MWPATSRRRSPSTFIASIASRSFFSSSLERSLTRTFGSTPGLREQLLRGRKTDAEDVGEGDLDALLARQIDAGNTSHALPLNLFVLGIDAADHAHFAFAADDLAFIADALDGRSDFHVKGAPSRLRATRGTPVELARL